MNLFKRSNKPAPFFLYGFTSLLAFLMALCALFANHVYPFGGEYLTWMDNGAQVAVDFGYAQQIVNDRSDFFWSYANGGMPRSSFHPTFNNICFPWVWIITWLPCAGVLPKLSYLFLLQVALMPLGALFYVRRTFPRVPASIAVLLALSYTFAEFLFTKYTFLPFLNIAILFPFFLYALDKLLKQGRWVPYSLILTFMLAVGTYFAYMWLLFSIVYAASRTGWTWRSPIRQYSATLLWASILSILLSAAWWWPSYLITSNSSRAAASNWQNMPSLRLVKEIFSLWLLPFVGLVLVILSPVRKRVFSSRYGLSLAVLMVSLFLGSSNYIWHVSVPCEFPGRFSYMAAMMMVCMGAHAWRRNISCVKIIGLLPFALVLLVLYLNALPGTTRSAMDILWFVGALFSLFLFRGKMFRYGIIGVVIIMMLGLTGHVAYHVKKCAKSSMAGNADRVMSGEWAASHLPPRNGEFYGRAKGISYDLIDNVALFTPFESLGHFNACHSVENTATMARWGHAYFSFGILSDNGGTVFSDTIFGTRYYIVDGASYVSHGVPLASNGEYSLYENPWYFGFGLMLPSSVDLDMHVEDVAFVQEEAIRRILGKNAQVHRDTRVVSEIESVQPWTYLVQPDWRREVTCTYEHSPYERWNNQIVMRSPPLPTLQLLPEHTSVRMKDQKKGASIKYETLTIEKSTLDVLKAYALDLPVHVSYSGKIMNIQCESTKERNMLFLPLLWQDGYSARDASGTPLQVKKNGGFVSIHFQSSGQHHVILEWKMPGSTMGWLFSALGLLSFLFLLRWRRMGNSGGCFNNFCRRGLLVGCLVLFMMPILTFPIGYFQLAGILSM